MSLNRTSIWVRMDRNTIHSTFLASLILLYQLGPVWIPSSDGAVGFSFSFGNQANWWLESQTDGAIVTLPSYAWRSPEHCQSILLTVHPHIPPFMSGVFIETIYKNLLEVPLHTVFQYIKIIEQQKRFFEHYFSSIYTSSSFKAMGGQQSDNKKWVTLARLIAS